MNKYYWKCHKCYPEQKGEDQIVTPALESFSKQDGTPLNSLIEAGKELELHEALCHNGAKIGSYGIIFG